MASITSYLGIKFSDTEVNICVGVCEREGETRGMRGLFSLTYGETLLGSIWT